MITEKVVTKREIIKLLAQWKLVANKAEDSGGAGRHAVYSLCSWDLAALAGHPVEILDEAETMAKDYREED